MSLRVEEDCLNKYKLHKPQRKRLKILMLNLRFRTLLEELKKVKIQATNWEKLPVTQITDRGAQDTQRWKNFCEPLRKRQSNGKTGRASLAVQRLRICRPVQGTQVQSLLQEDPTCRRAHGPQLLSWSPRAWELPPLKPMSPEPVLHGKRRPRRDKPTHSNSGATTRHG